MLIPIGHENMSVRRWPVITGALILINVLAFVATNSTLQQEASEMGTLKVHILLLAAMHPELNVPQEVEPLVTSFRENHPEDWEKINKQELELVDEYDARIRITQDQDKLQAEIDSLAKEYERISDSFLANQYAFIPANPKPISYLTANFLHGGWLHLIGNMWFLWLAGFVLEDVWGRGIYLVTYLVAGAAALQFHAWTNPGSFIPTLGASGAVAALMGAFLVRFPKIKIEMMWVFALIRRRRFHAPAYWLLPLWLLTEVFYGSISGEGGGVAHWAHVGGFLFGAVVALALRFSGVEHKVNASIEKQIGRTGDPEMDQAHEYLDHGQIELAVAVLQSYTTAKPAAFEAWNLLRDVYWQKRDMAAFQQAALKCCDLHLKARDEEAAWRDYEDFVNSGGKDLPPRIWLDLCRVLENQSNYEAALGEYKKLAATHPADRQALLAQLAAGRLCMKKLSRPKDALKFYEAAETSTVPHLDLEQTIESAIHEAKAVLSFMASNAERNAATARPAAP